MSLDDLDGERAGSAEDSGLFDNFVSSESGVIFDYQVGLLFLDPSENSVLKLTDKPWLPYQILHGTAQRADVSCLPRHCRSRSG